MKHTIHIPVINKTITIYTGKEHFQAYIKHSQKHGFSGESDLVNAECDGLAAGTIIYLKDKSNKNIAYHEITHALQDLLVFFWSR